MSSRVTLFNPYLAIVVMHTTPSPQWGRVFYCKGQPCDTEEVTQTSRGKSKENDIMAIYIEV